MEFATGERVGIGLEFGTTFQSKTNLTWTMRYFNGGKYFG